MDWKKLTENRYTTNDIFAKNYQVWLMLPLMFYLLANFVHLAVYTFTFIPNTEDARALLVTLTTGRNPGDYQIAILDCALLLGVIAEFVGIFSYLVNQKQSKIKAPKADYIPLGFFGVFAALAVVACLVNGGVPDELLWGTTVRAEPFVGLLAYFLVYYLCGSLIRKEKYKYLAIYTYLAMTLMVALVVLWDQYVTPMPMGFLFETGIGGIFFHFNFYGYVLCMAIMLAAALVLMEQKKGRRIFAFFMMCLNTFILALNNTMGCFLACIVAFLFMIVAVSLKKHKFSVGAVALFIIFLAISFLVSLRHDSFFTQLIGLAGDVKSIATNAENADEAGTARWGLWVAQIPLIKERPWIGHGFEGACAALEEAAGQDKVHNEYLNYAGDYGIPAAIIYIAGLLAVYIKALKKRAQVDGATLCCLVGALAYIGSAFFGNTVFYVAPFFFIFLGLANSISSPELVAEMNAKVEPDAEEDSHDIETAAEEAGEDAKIEEDSGNAENVAEAEEATEATTEIIEAGDGDNSENIEAVEEEPTPADAE